MSYRTVSEESLYRMQGFGDLALWGKRTGLFRGKKEKGIEKRLRPITYGKTLQPHPASKKYPLIKKEEPLAKKPAPLIKKEEPLAKKPAGKSGYIKEETFAMKPVPLIKKEEPLAMKPAGKSGYSKEETFAMKPAEKSGYSLELQKGKEGYQWWYIPIPQSSAMSGSYIGWDEDTISGLGDLGKTPKWLKKVAKKIAPVLKKIAPKLGKALPIIGAVAVVALTAVAIAAKKRKKAAKKKLKKARTAAQRAAAQKEIDAADLQLSQEAAKAGTTQKNLEAQTEKKTGMSPAIIIGGLGALAILAFALKGK